MSYMESFEEDDLLLRQEPFPVAKPKLRRLKKASNYEPRVLDPPPLPPSTHPGPSSPTLDLLESSLMPDAEESFATVEVANAVVDLPRSEYMEMEETRPEEEIDPLFPNLGGYEGWDAQDSKIALEEDQEEWIGGIEREEHSGRREGGEMTDGIGKKKKSGKKRLSLKGGDEEEGEASKRRKKKNDKSCKSDGKPKESVREKRRIEKERKTQLAQIHAESQRLLRETKDASFRPVPLAHKPISSVLEKIRLRKLEVLGKSNILNTSQFNDTSASIADIGMKTDLIMSLDEREDDSDVEMINGAEGMDAVGCGNILKQCETAKVFDSNLEDAIQNSLADDPSTNHDHSYQENKKADDIANDTLSNFSCASLPDSSSKLASTDGSSSEEDNDKENYDPQPDKRANMDSYVKDFLDDEAEEEDDSDHDLTRFQENEEDDVSDENEVLTDLIANDFEEAPIDIEKRNQLHLKWLEQQDAAETDNVMQRLKYSKKKNETTVLDKENLKGSEGFEEEESSDLPTIDLVRKNSKIAKQMIAKMFTDDRDVYEPSDDEETEQTLIRQRLSNQTEESTFASPTKDENSRELFGLIKKLNIASQSKKRVNTSTSSFDMLMTSHNSNSSSKSSFLGRATNCTIQSSHKPGLSNARAFIFGRDDSNSRSGLSASDKLSDVEQMEDQPKKGSSTKLSISQMKSAASRPKVEAHKNSGSSLFDILRQSSINFDKQLEAKKQNKNRTESETAGQFSAFKLGRFPKG